MMNTDMTQTTAEPTQAQRDAAYIWSWDVLKRLREMSVITAAEAEKTRAGIQRHYKSAVIVS